MGAPCSRMLPSRITIESAQGSDPGKPLETLTHLHRANSTYENNRAKTHSHFDDTVGVTIRNYDRDGLSNWFAMAPGVPTNGGEGPSNALNISGPQHGGTLLPLLVVVLII